MKVENADDQEDFKREIQIKLRDISRMFGKRVSLTFIADVDGEVIAFVSEKQFDDILAMINDKYNLAKIQDGVN